MKKMLVLCARDWLHPRAGAVPTYVHEVFSRIASAGHYVAWISHHFGFPLGFGKGQPDLSNVDGIHLARLGNRLLYRPMVGMMLKRLTATGRMTTAFDVVVDCINGNPLPVQRHCPSMPSLPVVFRLSRRVQADGESPGPVIATGPGAREQLLRGGLQEKFIINAPFGLEGPGVLNNGQGHAMTWDQTAGLVLAAIENLAKDT